MRKTIARIATASVAAAALGVATAGAAAADSHLGNRSLAEVLTADGDQFDGNWYDYDIVTEAVLAVVNAKPDSPVGLLTQGDVALTAFIPNDRAFQKLAADLTGTWIKSEGEVFNTLVSAVGVDAIEQVLLYHVVPGKTITAATALKSDGVRLKTAQGARFKIDVLSQRYKIVQLIDKDYNDVNAFLNPKALDVNSGNKQIAHGVLFVMRPLDL